ncbi:MAG TPA: M13 family metallopeptidase [Candidatus Eisenbacteria bacterium]
MKSIVTLLACPVLALLASGCSQPKPADKPAAQAAPKVTADTYLAQFVDTTVTPSDDFFHFAVGGWLKRHPIPESERSWGIGKVVQEETYHRLLEINQEAAVRTDAAPGNNAQKIGDFWAAGMDTAAIDSAGYKPLQAEFDRIDAITDRKSLLDVIARLQYIGAGPLYGQYIFQDEKDSEHEVLHLYQGGLGLPNRDYYVDPDARSTHIRREYVAHVAKMLQLMGDTPEAAKKASETIMRLETDLAKASRKLEDLRDPEANYNPMTVATLARLTPSIDWKAMLEAGNIRDIDKVVVGQPEFFRQVEKSLRTHSIDEWKTYLRWNLANTFADAAGGAFDRQNFQFYETVLAGTKTQRPRWKRVLDAEENYLGDALGELYVERYFGPETKLRYAELTNKVFDAFRARIHNLTWMSEATRERALKKLSSVTVKVGYPDKWRDYSNYPVSRESHLKNVMYGNIWASEYAIAKLHKPVDRTEWDMTPQTYNAYYNPSNNEIVMPAAAFILPGIDDQEVDDALVYGYAGGTTIGHEITHGFDDDGRQFDEKGNLEDWWTKEDAAEFEKRAERIVAQFNDYVVLDSLHVNGKATSGENIADLGGMLLAWDAFTQTAQYKEGKKLGGFTPAQRFFIGWSLGWMNHFRPETQALRIKTDVHSPAFLRVNGPMANLPQFYEAWNVKPGDRMHRADDVRVSIW